MRAFLILLAIAAPVVLVAPTFWSLWRLETSVEQVVFTHQDGVSQVGWIGPKSPRPNWATIPANANIRVQSHFEPAPGQPSSGYADVRAAGAAAAVIAEYERRLAADGWTVGTYRLDLTSPDLPPRPLRTCVVHATRDGRGLMLELDREGDDPSGRLFWSKPPHPVPIGAKPGC